MLSLSGKLAFSINKIRLPRQKYRMLTRISDFPRFFQPLFCHTRTTTECDILDNLPVDNAV